jgi:hypothetical protein
VCYAIRRIESLRHRDTAVDALISKLSELCQQDTGEQLDASASLFRKILRDHLDDALVNKLVDRIADRILLGLQLRAASLGQLPE